MQTVEVLDLSRKRIVPPVLAKQGDVGRKFKAVITDGGVAYTIPAGAKFSVWYSGPSGQGNYSAIDGRSAFSVSGNTVTVELITQMLQNAGAGTMCLVMNAADGSQIGLWNLVYVTECVPGMGSAAAEQYFSAMSELVRQITEAAADLRKLNTMAVVLPASKWASNAQTVNLAGVTANGSLSDVFAAPAPADDNLTAYADSNVRLSEQLDGAVVFRCDTAPTVDLTVNVMVRA